MRINMRCFILLIVLMTSQLFAGTDYYVDATNGSDSNPGTITAPWRTISKVNSTFFSPGDIIHFKRGENWEETLIPSNSGSYENPITFTYYGIGDAPAIKGTDTHISGWTNYSGNIWYKGGFANNPDAVYLDEEGYARANNRDSVNSTYKWFYDSGEDRIYIYSTGDPGSYYSSIEIPIRNNTVHLTSNMSYLTFDGIYFWSGITSCVIANGIYSYLDFINCTFLGAGVYTICMGGTADNITFDNCQIHGRNRSRYNNVMEVGGPNFMNFVLKNSEISRGTHAGLMFQTNGFIIENNEFWSDGYGNNAYGRNIDIYGAQNGTIRYNVFRNAGYGNGIVQGGDQLIASNVDIYYNIFKNGEYQGLQIWMEGTYNSSNLRFWNNVIYGSKGVGVFILAGSDLGGGNEFKNNIIFENDDANHYQVKHLDPTTKKPDFFNNCIFDSSTSNTVFDGSSARTITYMNANYDEWSDDIAFDPECVDPANGEFYLLNNSFCINAGLNVGLTEDFDGNAVPYGYGVDIGAYEYTGENPLLNANADASPTSGETPLNVNLTGTATGGTSPYSYSWDFGDGQSSTQQNPSHIFNSSGNYTVTLTVTDSNNDQDSDSLIITVTDPVPSLIASSSASPTSGDSPLTVNFTGNATGGVSPYTYSWDFGDGQFSNQQNPSHTYNSSGSNTVTLTVTDSASNQDSDSLTITVTTPPPPPLVASCIASPNSGNVPFTVYFTGSATGGTPPYSYSWNFGDSGNSTQQNPSHIYNIEGNYTVTLTVTDSQSIQDSVSLTIIASVSPTPAYLSCSPTNFYFGASVSSTQPISQSLRIINAGDGTMTWNITESTSWLSCSPTSGADRGQVTITANPSGLSPGTYDATITVSSPQAYNSPQLMEVNLRVYEAGNEPDPPRGGDDPFDGAPVVGRVNLPGRALGDDGAKGSGTETNSDPNNPTAANIAHGLVTKENDNLADKMLESDELIKKSQLQSDNKQDKTNRLEIGLKEIWTGLELHSAGNTEREKNRMTIDQGVRFDGQKHQSLLPTKNELTYIPSVHIEELEPLRIILTSSYRENLRFIGWGEDEKTALPFGSTLDTVVGEFSWIPQPGSIGQYILHFAVTDGSHRSPSLRIVVEVIPRSHD